MREFLKFLYELMYGLISDVHIIPMMIGIYFLTKLCEYRNDIENISKLRKKTFILIGLFFSVKMFIIFFGNEIFRYVMSLL